MSFDPLAAAYDVMSDPAARLAKEGAFLKTLAPPGTRVLDLACATGVHAEFLARWGAEVTARDLAPSMIEYARAVRRHERVRYEEGDMREPPPGPFDLALCIGNSLNMLPDREAVAATLAGARKVLAGGGGLLLHGINPESPAHRSQSLAVKIGEAGGRTVTVAKAMVPRKTGRLVSVTHCFETAPPGDGPPEIRTSASWLLDLAQPEADALLAAAGFAERTWYGDLAGAPFSREGSPDWVVVARAEPA